MMKTTDLIPFIRHIINELSVSGDTFSDETDKAIEDFIRAAMTQLAAMPAYQGASTLLADTSSVTFSPRPDGLYCAIIKVPEDFLRPVSVNLEGWVRPVYHFLPAIGSQVLREYSSAPGIGSGPNSPSAYITKDAQQIIVAHAVSKPGDYNLRYVAVPQIAADLTIPVPSCYREALAYTAAALYMQSINEYDAAKAAFDTAASYIQTINNKIIE